MSVRDVITGTFAPNNLDAYRPAPCPRCNGEPEIEWLEMTNWGDGLSRWMLPVRALCVTPGCVDVEGGSGVPLSTEVQGRQRMSVPDEADRG